MEPEEYAETFSSTVTNGFIALEIAIGDNLRPFDSLKKFTSPVTPTELAVSCKLKERYEHSLDFDVPIPLLNLSQRNRSRLASVLPNVAANTSSLLECFNEDGPKGYDYSNQLDTLMWLDHDNKSCDSKWINGNLFPTGHKETDTLSNVLDFGCGPGSLTIKIAEHLPNAKVYGVDIDRKSIEKAKENKAKENIPNVEFVLLENDHLDESWTKKFDWITMVYVLHDLPNPNFRILDIQRVLKDDRIISVIVPCVHSDHKMNQGNQSAAMLMSREPAAANGIGWGVQTRAEFIKSHGFKILGLGAGGKSNEVGRSAVPVCMPHDPDNGQNSHAKHFGTLYGMEYNDPGLGQNLYDKDAPCAVCRVNYVSSVVTIPGKSTCYKGWNLEYSGILVAGQHTDAGASAYICLDQSPDVLEGGSEDMGGYTLFPVKAYCGSLRCPPYIQGSLVKCAVCSR
ncbi:unnamed protein product [Mytilus coruscus]|uniref:Methyltransferase domain-containing protein n=1 Tax=Mytilus coruscus TaxID=42192 RepID=A0A6J8BBT7_MYTCO|nr:unnamed protein product [Mytilus coruscus]